MFRSLPLLFSILIATAGFGQDTHHHGRCKAHTISERHLLDQGLSPQLQAALPRTNGGERGDVLTVSVVVHVVWNTAAENVPTSAILAMINEMNQDFSQSNSDINGVRAQFGSSIGNVGIQFCLAQVDPWGNTTTGITRTQTTDTWFDPDNQTDAMKSAPLGTAAWDPSEYLNIWICDISSGAQGGMVTLGYAYLPVGGVVGTSIDGLVIDYNYGLPLGSRTATHEIGHYFGLQHPWADGDCISDDGFTDTPNTDSPTFSCANTTLQKCATLTQYENFMDYSNCPVMFTIQQRGYMRSILNGVRSSLLNSVACGGFNPGSCIPTSAFGTGDGDFINAVQLGSINNVNSGGVGMPSYADLSNTWSTALEQGSTHVLTIQGGDYYPDHYAAWIDLDQDDLFEASEKLGEFTTSSAGETQTITFTVPANAAIGNTTLRIRGVYHTTDEPSPTDPCFNYAYGETEDYGIVITGLNGGAYCIPTSEFGTSDGDFINGVSLVDINNVNTGNSSGPSYNDYTMFSTPLIRGQVYSISISGGEYFPDVYAIWIDLNGDGQFTSSEKFGEFATAGSYETQNITFSIPNTADLGSTTMRVRGVYVEQGDPFPIDPCYAYAYGETEDYTVVIDGSTGMAELNAGQVRLYPNPASDQVTVVVAGEGTAQISLIDALGREVATYSSSGNMHVLPLASIVPGYYVLRVEQGDSLEILRLEIIGQ